VVELAASAKGTTPAEDAEAELARLREARAPRAMPKE